MLTCPEEEALLCCARVCVGSKPAERAPELLQQVTDWARFFRLASWHCVAPLVCNLLDQVCWKLPEPYAQQFQAESHDRARQALGLTAELLRVLELFELNNIPAVPFKGPVLASSLYGNVALRESVDLDILIRRQDALRAKEVMLAQGYRTDLPADLAQEAAYLRARYELHFMPEDGACLIEIHQAFLAPFYCLPFDYDSLWQRVKRKPFFGREILTLAPDDELLVLCAHGAKHSWTRLGWVCDIARLLVVCGDGLHWPQIMNHASTLHASRILLLGLFLARHLLDVPVPEEIAQLAEEDTSVARLGRSVVESLFREVSVNSDLRGHLFFLKVRERSRDKLAYCARLAFTPTEEDHSALSLPSLLSSLYYPLHAVRVMGKYGLTSFRSLL